MTMEQQIAMIEEQRRLLAAAVESATEALVLIDRTLVALGASHAATH
jgi:hypothetical protein